MAYRKRRSPAPAFRQPAAYNPISGEFAQIGKRGLVSRVAMMQIIEEDTHDNYVVCRGYDPETMKFLKTVNVAKPFGIRGTSPYAVAEVYPAIRAVGFQGDDIQEKLGDTSGVAHDSTGQPADLDEAIDILYDDDEKVISWLLLDAARSSTTVRYGILRSTLEVGGSCIIEEWEWVDGSIVCTGETFRGYAANGDLYGIEDEACVEWHVDPIGLTGADLDAAGIELPDGEEDPGGDVATIDNMTCVGFVCQRCGTPGT